MNQVTVGSLTSKTSTFVWEIKSFSTILVATGTSIYSPEFSTTSSNNRTLRWRLQLDPKGSNNESKDYVSVYLQNMNKFGIVAMISLSIMNDSYKDVFKLVSNPTYSNTNVATFNAEQSWGWPKFEKRYNVIDNKNRTLVNDTLIISCAILSANSPLDGYDIDGDNAIVSKYNEQLFETGNYSDVTFFVEDKEMNLHKNIVASLSPVFEAMFSSEMLEKKDNVVVIKDVKYDTMKELFRYIYTRNVNNIDYIANDLLIAAEKYAITGLKVMCEINLGITLNDDNALPRLEVAVMYNTSYLKKSVSEYVASRLKMFVIRDDFKELNHECKDEIFKALAGKQSIDTN